MKGFYFLSVSSASLLCRMEMSVFPACKEPRMVIDGFVCMGTADENVYGLLFCVHNCWKLFVTLTLHAFACQECGQ
jgi:hypothetical protein